MRKLVKTARVHFLYIIVIISTHINNCNIITIAPKSCPALRGMGGSLHGDGSTSDRCHAGKRNVVILPIAETTRRTHPSPKGANASAKHRPRLASFLPSSVRRVERNLLDNVRRVHLDDNTGSTYGWDCTVNTVKKARTQASGWALCDSDDECEPTERRQRRWIAIRFFWKISYR